MTNLISLAQKPKDGKEATGAFVKGVQEKMDMVKPHLARATPEMISTLYELCCSVEAYVAIGVAQERRRDAIAKEQQKEDSVQAAISKEMQSKKDSAAQG